MTELRQQVVYAIQRARQQIRWKPGKAEQHLSKRILLGHLAPGTTVEAYESMILHVLNEPQSRVFIFTYAGVHYPTVVTTRSTQIWLVMLDMTGRMETAFVVEKPDVYFDDPRFTSLGRVAELET